jgi:tricorn protease
MRATIIATLLSLLASTAAAETRLLRFPDLYGDTVVFTYAGDLWLANTEGTNVRRLTSHPGQELFGRFSPDGQHIAFTGQYDGGEQVYVVPVTGGEPTRLTWYPSEGPLPARWGYDHQVYGWTPDGEAVLFRSAREGFSLSDARLYTAKLSGGLPEALPMVVSGAGTLSPGGDRILFSPLFRDFRT